LAFARLKLLAPDAQKTSDLYYTMNGFTAEVPLSQLKNVLSMEGKGAVKTITLAGRNVINDQVAAVNDGVVPNMVNSASLIGAVEAWDLGYTGSGTYVAIIDSGIDYKHENLGGHDTFPNEKVPYGYDLPTTTLTPWTPTQTLEGTAPT